jgi:hypothetical protein
MVSSKDNSIAANTEAVEAGADEQELGVSGRSKWSRIYSLVDRRTYESINLFRLLPLNHAPLTSNP